MAIITKVRTKSNGKIEVHLDSSFVVELDPNIVVLRGLQVGMELEDADLATLQELDRLGRSLDIARRYLARRPRSEKEVSRYLSRKGFTPQDIESTLARLRSEGWVDDLAYARLWVESRARLRPRSRRHLEVELRGQGVDSEIIEEALQDADDSAAAYQLASKRLRLGGQGGDRKHLASYLRRRGFDPGVINETLRRLAIK